MHTPAQLDMNRAANHRPRLTVKTVVLAFALAEAVMIGWMLFSGHIR
ncbi:MAG TPA: hypothetical protein VFJ16_03690 [Longimicrobium sp.]|nr:hypothetical protein [Longimicrobium sp.]